MVHQFAQALSGPLTALDLGEDDRADQNLAAGLLRTLALFIRRLLAGDLLLLGAGQSRYGVTGVGVPKRRRNR